MKDSIDMSGYDSRHSIGNRLARGLWTVVWCLFFRPGFSSCICFARRRVILRLFGADIGEGAHVYGSCRIWAPWKLRMGKFSCLGPYVSCYNVACIEIKDNVTVSQNTHLCSAGHDIKDPSMRLTAEPIKLFDGAWVGADAFIGAGVTVGEGAVVGARAVVVKDVEPWTIVAGNPAVQKGRRELRETDGGKQSQGDNV